MISRLGRMMIEMWRDARPKMVAEMEKEGILMETVEKIQDLALMEISTLVERGVPEFMARERVVEKLRLPFEDEEPENDHLPYL